MCVYTVVVIVTLIHTQNIETILVITIYVCYVIISSLDHYYSFLATMMLLRASSTYAIDARFAGTTLAIYVLYAQTSCDKIASLYNIHIL